MGRVENRKGVALEQRDKIGFHGQMMTTFRTNDFYFTAPLMGMAYLPRR